MRDLLIFCGILSINAFDLSSISPFRDQFTPQWTFGPTDADFIVLEDRAIHSLLEPRRLVLFKANNEDSEKLIGCMSQLPLLESYFGKNMVEKMLHLLEEDGDEEEVFLVAKDPGLAKDERTTVHKAIRSMFEGFLESRTENPGGRDTASIIRVYSVKKSESGRGLKRGPERWDSTRPDYHHFLLGKRGLTTSEALDRIARSTGLLSSRFSAAGQKDKNALTLQIASVWRLPREDSLNASRFLKVKNIAVGGVMPANSPVRLGQLQGNVFSITLRPVSAHRNDDDDKYGGEQVRAMFLEAVREASGRPHFNYFGRQRFGQDLSTVRVGEMLLQGRYHDAILLLLVLPTGQREAALAEGWSGSLLGVGSDTNSGFGVDVICSLFGRDDGLSALKECWRDYCAYAREESADNAFLDARLSCVDDVLDLRPPRVPKGTPFVQRALLESIAKELRKSERSKDVKRDVETVTVSKEEKETKIEPEIGTKKRLDWRKIFHAALPKNVRHLFVNAVQSALWNTVVAKRCGGSSAGSSAREGDLVLLDESGVALTAWDTSRQNVNLVANRVALPGETIQISVEEQSPQARIHVVTAAQAKAGRYSLDAVVEALPGDRTVVSAAMRACVEAAGMELLLNSSMQTDVMFRLPGAYRHVLTQARHVHYRVPSESSSWIAVSNECGNGGNGHGDDMRVMVRRQWESGRLASLLDSIYQSTPPQGNELPPRLCTPQLNSDRNSDSDSSAIINSAEHGQPLKGMEGAIQISFSLPQSCYATTFLELLSCEGSYHPARVGQQS